MPRLTDTSKQAVAADADDATDPVLPIESAGAETIQHPPPAPAKKAATKRPAKAPADDLGFIALDEADEFLNVLWYGREGTGKTTDVAMMANLDHPGKVLVVNSEGGLKASALRRRGVDTSRLILWPTPGDAITFDRLEALFLKLQADLTEDPKSWAGVGFDSLTEIHKTLLDDIVQNAVAKAARAGKDRDRFFTDRADYGVMTEQVRLLVRRFRDLPCHFGITCLERRDQDDDTGKIFYGPALTPALQTDVLGYVDLVIRTEGDELQTEDGPVTEFTGLTRPQGRYRAKDRFDATPRLLVDPDFLRIHAYVTGIIDETSDPAQEDSAARHAAATALAAKQEAEKQARKDRARGKAA